MSRSSQDEQASRVVLRALRSFLLMVIFTAGSLFSLLRHQRPLNHNFYPPHGGPLLYAIAMSWLIAIIFAVPSAIIFNMNPRVLSLARWEKEGEVYDHTGIRAFRWVLLHSPLGWINPALRLGVSRAGFEQLLREMNIAEGVHWLSCLFSSLLAILCLVRGYAAYGYVMLFVRIPFDVYPIMLQRWNRGRVCRVLRRQLRTPG